MMREINPYSTSVWGLLYIEMEVLYSARVELLIILLRH